MGSVRFTATVLVMGLSLILAKETCMVDGSGLSGKGFPHFQEETLGVLLLLLDNDMLTCDD